MSLVTCCYITSRTTITTVNSHMHGGAVVHVDGLQIRDEDIDKLNELINALLWLRDPAQSSADALKERIAPAMEETSDG